MKIIRNIGLILLCFLFIFASRKENRKVVEPAKVTTPVILKPVELDLPEGWIFKQVAYYCDSFNVPKKYIYDVGMNESGWRNPNDSNFIIGPWYVPGESSHGDLQMINSTWRIYSKRLGLTKKTRKNLLIACIAMSKDCYLLGDSSWRKARYIYARGRWKSPSKWTKLERKFMSKMNFEKYN